LQRNQVFYRLLGEEWFTFIYVLITDAIANASYLSITTNKWFLLATRWKDNNAKTY